MSEQRINILEQTVVRIDGKLDGIAETLQSLARIEERQMSTTERLRNGAETMQDHEERLRAIEVRMPGLVESRKWVVMGVLSGVGMIGAALLHMVLK